MNNKQKQNGQGIEGIAIDPNRFKALSIDWELYADYLEESDLSEEQKREFLETLWSIIVSFVDLGFGLHPARKVCEQMDEKGNLGSANVVELPAQFSQKAFSKAADRKNFYPWKGPES